jgi:fatty acid desaturase
MVQASLAFGSRSGGVPSTLNFLLASFYIAANVFQFIILPVWLLSENQLWGLVLLPLALLTNPFWSLIHEAIHDLFHNNKVVNAFFGRLLGILFGSPFRILRMSHLLHHKLNRLPVEGTEYYDREKCTKAAASPGYFFQIFLGLYLVEVASPAFFLLPRKGLEKFRQRFLSAQSVSGMLMQIWLSRESLREIRIDGVLTIFWLSVAFYLYGRCWPMLLGALLARGFLISFLDNVYHYETPVGNIFFAKNLKLPTGLTTLFLNFNLHGIHHINPAISWVNLPHAFEVQGARYQGGFFAAAVRQLQGPIALQDLPEGEPALRLRPF